MHKYSIKLAWSEEDGGFIATSSEFPGVSAFGESQKGALAELNEALSAAIEVLEEDGLRLPAPRPRQRYSGQTRLRMPSHLHERLVEQAEQEGVSFNTLVVTYLSECVGAGAMANAAVASCKSSLAEFRATLDEIGRLPGEFAVTMLLRSVPLQYQQAPGEWSAAVKAESSWPGSSLRVVSQTAGVQN